MTRLAEFIKDNMNVIIDEWEKFAHSIPTGAPKMTRIALRDHLPEILAFIARDITTDQSHEEQKLKSQGGRDSTVSSPDTAAEIHGVLRLENGFDIKQMISEFRALRASVTKLWIKQSKVLAEDQLTDLIRFNEAIDQSLAESVSRFTKDLDASKDLFLGILGHDIRNPLGAISMSATLLKRAPLNDLQSKLTQQIQESSSRIQEIVSHLLELTKARLGAKIPLLKEPVNFEEITEKIIAEVQIMFPEREIILNVDGNVNAQADIARFEQVLSNLIGNSMQYGEKDLPVTVRIKENPTYIRLSVHNMGQPIPSATLTTIFDSLVRGSDDEADSYEKSANLGLGLYIVKSIVKAHGGEMSVVSTKDQGTTFTADFPK